MVIKAEAELRVRPSRAQDKAEAEVKSEAEPRRERFSKGGVAQLRRHFPIATKRLNAISY